MARPKKGEKGYEEAKNKWRETMLRKYGGEEGLRRQFQKMGAKGGRASGKGGFYANRELARIAGTLGGLRSRRGYKLVDGKYIKRDIIEES